MTPAAGAADLAEIRTRGSLRVLAAADEDPVWFSRRGGASPGFEREIFEGFARLQKLRFEVVPVARWEQAIPMLLRQEGDVLGGISATPERRLKGRLHDRAAAGAQHRGHEAPAGGDPVARRAAHRAARDRTGHDLAEALEKAGVPVARCAALVPGHLRGDRGDPASGIADATRDRRRRFLHPASQAPGDRSGPAARGSAEQRVGRAQEQPRAAPSARRLPGPAPPQPQLEPAAGDVLRRRRSRPSSA